MILIDSYQADDAYFDAVKEFVQTACLEDMGGAASSVSAD